MPANSVLTSKGIKIYFTLELRENESYIEISEIIIGGWSYAPSFRVVDKCIRVSMLILYAKIEGCKHADEFGFSL